MHPYSYFHNTSDSKIETILWPLENVGIFWEWYLDPEYLRFCCWKLALREYSAQGIWLLVSTPKSGIWSSGVSYHLVFRANRGVCQTKAISHGIFTAGERCCDCIPLDCIPLFLCSNVGSSSVLWESLRPRYVRGFHRRPPNLVSKQYSGNLWVIRLSWWLGHMNTITTSVWLERRKIFSPVVCSPTGEDMKSITPLWHVHKLELEIYEVEAVWIQPVPVWICTAQFCCFQFFHI